MASPGRRSSNRSSSSSIHSSSYVTEPRTVDEYLKNFKLSVEDFYNTRNPHREKYHLLGDYIVPTNKRRLVMYVAHGPIDTARKISRIYYRLPVIPFYANMFDADAEPDETLPADGPLFKLFDVPAEHTASTLIDAIIAEVGRESEEDHLAPWTSEIARVNAIGKSERESLPRRRAANKLINFWTPLRGIIMEIIGAAGIILPDAAAAAVNAGAGGVGAGSRTSSFGGTPGRSSSGTRRRRLAERLRRRTRTKSNSDPSRRTPPNIYNTVLRTTRPVHHNDNIFTLRNISNSEPEIIKRVRRRRANSDPKDD